MCVVVNKVWISELNKNESLEKFIHRKSGDCFWNLNCCFGHGVGFSNLNDKHVGTFSPSPINNSLKEQFRFIRFCFKLGKTTTENYILQLTLKRNQ